MTAAEIRSAATELVALAARMREDWDEPMIWAAIASRQGAGWRPPQIAMETVRLAISAGARPGDTAQAMTRRRSRRSHGKRDTELAAVRTCAPQLVALVTAMRADWDAGQVHAALKACHAAGWPVTHAALELVRLAVIPASEPRDLEANARSPFSRRTLGDRRG